MTGGPMFRPRAHLMALGACLALAGVFSSPAHAGRYEVFACGEDGVTSGWQLGYSDYTTGGVNCPGGSAGARGIHVRNTGHPTVGAPGFTAGSATLSAPAGTAIVGLRGRADMNAALGWKSGIFDFTASRWLWCGPGCLSSFGLWPNFAIDGLWTFRLGGLVICGASSCGRSGSTPAGLMALSHVVATLEDTWQPNLALTGGSLRRGGWHRQENDLSWDANDNTGIRRFRVLLDGTPFESQERSCDPHSPTPCPNGGGRLVLDTAAFAKRDGSHNLRVEAYDAGGNLRSAEQSFLVDNSAPAQPLAATLVGGAGWRAANAFSVTWRNPGQDASPITGARFKLCPAALPPGAESGCASGARDAANI